MRSILLAIMVFFLFWLGFQSRALAIADINESGASAGVLKTTTIITGTIIAGEATALLLGVHVFAGGDNPWISSKNDLLLILDLITGIGMVYLAASDSGFYDSPIFLVLSNVALLTHGYREWEYLGGSPNSFCANLPLFIVNNLKLVGLVSVSAQSISLKINFINF